MQSVTFFLLSREARPVSLRMAWIQQQAADDRGQVPLFHCIECRSEARGAFACQAIPSPEKQKKTLKPLITITQELSYFCMQILNYSMTINFLM